MGGGLMEESMQEKKQWLLADGWASVDLMEQIHAPTLHSINKGNVRLIETLLFLGDAITFDAIDKWMWVGSAIYTLTDESLVSDFIKRIPSEHKARINRPRIKKFRKYLSHWRKNQVLYEQDTVEYAISLLNDRIFDNANLL